jgi:phosphopantothenoylcysteine synthetase/decarboxylase
VLLMAAAVADFTPAAPGRGGKIKKAGRERLELDLEPTADVLGRLSAARRDGQTLVGFAAEHGERARSSTAARSSPARVRRGRRQRHLAQRTSASTSDANEVTILTGRGSGAPAIERTCRGPPRRRSPRRSSTPSRGCAQSG